MKNVKKAVLLLLLCLMPVLAAVPAQAKTRAITLTLKSRAGTRPYYVKKGTKLQLKGKVGSKTYKGKKLKYVSSNKKVAKVSASGIVTTRRSGKTVITVSTRDGSKSARFALSVTKNGISVAQRAMNYKSRTNYKILINRGRHKIYIFQKKNGKWSRIKTFPCVVGAPGTQTPTGAYALKDRGPAFVTDSGRYCWYYIRIVDDICLHSQIYEAGSMTHIVDGTMSASASHGCVRLYLSDVKWIYDHVPIYTKVVIYN